MKITIRTIAEKAGVSVPTVSRVLNSPQLVSPDTRDRVLAVIESMDFYPNETARRLRSSTSRTFGVIVPQIRDFFFAEIYQGMFSAASALGANLLLHDAQSDENRLIAGFSELKRLQCKGIVFLSAPISKKLEITISRAGIPVVFALTEPPTGLFSSFRVDEVKAAFDAVAHLIVRGHRKIAMISGPLENKVTGTARWNGYQQALRHYGLEYNERRLAFGDFRFRDGYAAMETLLPVLRADPFTAIFAASDEMAIGAMRCLHDNGLRVPEHMSIVGFDNIPLAEMVIPALSTIAQPFADIGAAAVNGLQAGLDQDKSSFQAVKRYLPHVLVERESVRMISGDCRFE